MAQNWYFNYGYATVRGDTELLVISNDEKRILNALSNCHLTPISIDLFPCKDTAPKWEYDAKTEIHNGCRKKTNT